MAQFLRTILGIVGALVLMIVVGAATIVISDSNPGVEPVFFYVAGTLVYMLFLLFAISVLG